MKATKIIFAIGLMVYFITEAYFVYQYFNDVKWYYEMSPIKEINAAVESAFQKIKRTKESVFDRIDKINWKEKYSFEKERVKTKIKTIRKRIEDNKKQAAGMRETSGIKQAEITNCLS